jgi:hypothetical protein
VGDINLEKGCDVKKLSKCNFWTYNIKNCTVNYLYVHNISAQYRK